MPKFLLYLAAILLLSTSFSSCRREPPVRTPLDEEAIEATAKIERVNIYLENSGSMGGYFRYRTAFNEHLDNLIVELAQIYNDSVFAFTIAEEIKGYADIRKFREELNPTNLHKVAIGKSSPLDSIFHKVCASWNPGEVNILLTDGIISGTNEQMRRYRDGHYNIDHLNALRNNILQIFSRFSNRISVKVLGFKSEFNATIQTPYYKLDNDKVSGKVFPNRPYYLFIFGSPAQIRILESKCKYCRSSFALEYGLTDQTSAIATSVGKDRRGIIMNGEYLEFTQKQPVYILSLLADLSSVPDQYKTKRFLEENSYITVNGRKHENARFNFRNLTTREFDLLYKPETAETMQKIKGYTHYISVELVNYTCIKGDKIRFVIGKDNDSWYDLWNSDSDLEIFAEDSTTFALSTLIAGIEGAYQQPYVLSYNFKIK